jgi:hypothetical protein
MVKLMGILLMVIFGISGVGATALAWLFPWLNLNKTEATIAGLIGIGFIILQSLWLRHSRQDGEKTASVDIPAEDNN